MLLTNMLTFTEFLIFSLPPPPKKKREYTVKKRLAIFPSPAGMSQTKLSLAENNLIISGQGEFG
jgi:hypothetical protein